MNAASDGPVELACCFDRAYILPTAVMATSVLAHAAPGRRYILHLIYDGADDAPLEAFKGFESTRLEVRLVKAKNAFAGTPTAYPGMPAVSFLRLALAELLPGVPKVLSLDPDLICLTDVGPLFDTDLAGAAMAAAPDLAMANGLAGEIRESGAMREGSKHRYFAARLGLDQAAMADYFNAGVMVFDLDRFRVERFAAEARAFAARPGEPLRWSEQCVLNAFFAGRYRKLDARWNVMLDPPRLELYAAGGAGLLGRVAEARLAPSILHFNWTAKPWIADAVPTAYVRTWWAYALAAPLPFRAKLRKPFAKRQLLRRLADSSVRRKAAELRALLLQAS